MTMLSHPLAVLVAGSALLFTLQLASAQDADERALDRGAIPDTTPAQKYDTAIREAGGAYKAALAECKSLPKAEQGACIHEANKTYRTDMGAAQAEFKAGKAFK